MKLTAELLRQFRISPASKENGARINAFDFAANGETLISSSDDEQIVIYDCISGTRKHPVSCRKYGADLVRYTHSGTCCVHASSKVDHQLRYLSLQDRKYLRYFPGHTQQVICLCMSPVEDLVLSGSLDKSIRIWDLRSPNCQGLMQLPGRPCAAFDPEGLIFAAGINNESVKLYDLRSFDKGPFANFRVMRSANEAALSSADAEWTSLKFSPDGKSIAICMFQYGLIKLIDAFQGHVIANVSFVDARPTGASGAPRSALYDANFTPDGQFLLVSTGDAVHFWQMDSERAVNLTELNEQERAQHGLAPLGPANTLPIGNVAFNPKFMMFASCTSEMGFWIPRLDD